jgi:hypothetical protein
VPVQYDPNWQSNEFYLSNRFVDQEDSFIQLNGFPIYVLVLSPQLSGSAEVDRQVGFHTLAWATLHNTREDAEKELADWKYSEGAKE